MGFNLCRLGFKSCGGRCSGLFGSLTTCLFLGRSLANGVLFGAALFFLGTTNGIFRFTGLGHGKRATAKIHFFRRKAVQHDGPCPILLTRRL